MLGVADYIVCSIMLAMSLAVGIYYGISQRKNAWNVQEYLLGSRKMTIFPTSMSLLASLISGITVIGMPAETYVYGMSIWYNALALPIQSVIACYVYLPVFHGLKLTSVYEYFQHRFDKRTRLFASVLSLLTTITWLPIVLYIPALTFNQVTEVSIFTLSPIICIICVVYTCLGGIRAVVWTDVIQSVFMFAAILLIVIKGTIDIGGLGVIWKRGVASERIEPPDLNLDPTKRHTLWTVFFGGIAWWLQGTCVHQSMAQRYLSLPTMAVVKRTVLIFVVALFIFNSVCQYMGILIYATYHECDPLLTKRAKTRDQLVPLFAMDIFANLPGLPGLFFAGVFSAALSSLSTGLNAMSAVLLEDFYKPFFKHTLSERETAWFIRSVVAILGIICLALVFLVDKSSGILQLSMTLVPITNGPLLGLFTMGILLPWVNAKGALTGGVSGLLLMSWLLLKVQDAIASSKLTYPKKITSVDNCTYSFGPIETIQEEYHNNNDGFAIYKISYFYYTLLGAVITIIIALLVSLCTGLNRPGDIPQNVLTPYVRRYFKEESCMLKEPCESSELQNLKEIEEDN